MLAELAQDPTLLAAILLARKTKTLEGAWAEWLHWERDRDTRCNCSLINNKLKASTVNDTLECDGSGWTSVANAMYN
jgi:hypothetical protein